MRGAINIYFVCTDLGFFLNGTVHSNNSIVMLRTIGVGISALYCLTNNRNECCKASTSAGMKHDLWRFPNGSNVGEDTTVGIYFTRGFSSLHLNRRSSAVGPTGVYTCAVPDT
jgi:hypothetical protein